MDFPSHIVITGASGAIGAALAKIYSKQGVHLSLFGRKKSELEAVANECRRLLATALIYIVDITKTDELQIILNEIDAENPVDLIVVNAGIANHLTVDCDEESWMDTKELFDINLVGALATVSPFITTMRKRKRGQIALMSSMLAFYGVPIAPAYSASKAALKSYGESLRGLLSREKIKVSVIFPGFVESRMTENFLGNKPFLMTADKAAKIIKSGLEKNKARIAFPFFLTTGMRFLSIFPCFISNFILLKLGYSAIKK